MMDIGSCSLVTVGSTVGFRPVIKQSAVDGFRVDKIEAAGSDNTSGVCENGEFTGQFKNITYTSERPAVCSLVTSKQGCGSGNNASVCVEIGGRNFSGRLTRLGARRLLRDDKQTLNSAYSVSKGLSVSVDRRMDPVNYTYSYTSQSPRR